MAIPLVGAAVAVYEPGECFHLTMFQESFLPELLVNNGLYVATQPGRRVAVGDVPKTHIVGSRVNRNFHPNIDLGHPCRYPISDQKGHPFVPTISSLRKAAGGPCGGAAAARCQCSIGCARSGMARPAASASEWIRYQPCPQAGLLARAASSNFEILFLRPYSRPDSIISRQVLLSGR